VEHGPSHRSYIWMAYGKMELLSGSLDKIVPKTLRGVRLDGYAVAQLFEGSFQRMLSGLRCTRRSSG